MSDRASRFAQPAQFIRLVKPQVDMAAVSAEATQDPGIVKRKKSRLGRGLKALLRDTSDLRGDLVKLREEVATAQSMRPRAVRKEVQRDPETGRIVRVVETPVHDKTVKEVQRDDEGRVTGVVETKEPSDE